MQIPSHLLRRTILGFCSWIRPNLCKCVRLWRHWRAELQVLLVAPHHGIDCCKCGRTAAVFRKAGCMEDRAQNGTCGEASRSCTLRSLKVKLSWPARVAKTGRPVTRLQPCMATGRWHKTRLIADGSSGVALTPAWKLVARDATCALDPAQIEFALLSWPLLLDQKPHFLS